MFRVLNQIVYKQLMDIYEMDTNFSLIPIRQSKLLMFCVFISTCSGKIFSSRILVMK